MDTALIFVPRQIPHRCSWFEVRVRAGRRRLIFSWLANWPAPCCGIKDRLRALRSQPGRPGRVEGPVGNWQKIPDRADASQFADERPDQSPGGYRPEIKHGLYPSECLQQFQPAQGHLRPQMQLHISILGKNSPYFGGDDPQPVVGY